MTTISISEVANHARERFALLDKAWEGDDAFPVKLPADKDLQVLLEESFWASISRDEGRPCRFELALYSSEQEAGRASFVRWDPKRFDRTLLRRLAAVAHSADSEIVLVSARAGLSVVGLSKYFRKFPELHERVAIPIRLEARRPGHITLRYGIFRVLTYCDGALPTPGPNILYAQGPFRSVLDELGKAANLAPFEFHSTLAGILKQIEANCHGGLIIVSATEPLELDSVAWRIADQPFGLPDVVGLQRDLDRRIGLPKDDPDWTSFSSAVHVSEDLNALAREVAEFSASLALTDGALWLDETLRPRAFGAFTRLGSNVLTKTSLDAAATALDGLSFDTLGARHRAMANLAYHNRDCPVIAVSVDGGFAAALYQTGRNEVLVWKFQSWDLELDDPFDPQCKSLFPVITPPNRSTSEG